MASFDNSGQVHQQIAHQVISGNVYNIAHDATTGKRQKLHNEGDFDIKVLDDEVLESLSFPEMTDRRRNIALPHQRTCQWIFELEQYKKWTASQAGLFWIKGKPGAGKSTLMSHLYHKIGPGRPDSSGDDIFLEFFFNARGTSLEQSFLGLLRCLSNQLFYYDVAGRDLLRNSYQNKQKSFGNRDRSWNWQQSELEKLFTDMALGSAKRQPLFIFVDALDEAGGQAAREIATFFYDLERLVIEQSATAKICVSTRHYPVVAQPSTTEICVEHHNGNDIMAYTQNQFQTITRGRTTDIGLKDLIQELVSRANGIFQWVRLVVPMVHEWMDDGDSIDQIKKRLLQVPIGLGQVYEHILKKVIDPRHQANSLRLFQWVCLATHPLSVTELRYAITACDLAASQSTLLSCKERSDFAQTDETMLQRIRSWSGGLIEVIELSGDKEWSIDLEPGASKRLAVAQPIHQSVHDFMVTRGLSILNGTRLAHLQESIPEGNTINVSADEMIATSHGVLYWACLYYIATEKLNPSLVNLDGDNWYAQESKLLTLYPLLYYAVAYMFEHGQKALSHRKQDLAQELRLINSIIPSLVFAHRILYFGTTSIVYDTTPLHIAAQANLIDLAAFIDKQNGNLHAINGYGCTALHLAAESGGLDMVMALVTMGLDTEAESYTGGTPLIVATAANHAAVARWLLGRSTESGEPLRKLDVVLVAAAACGDLIMVEQCIAAGANINYQGRCYQNPLCWNQIANSDQFEASIYPRRDIYRSNEYYGNALQAACHNGHWEVVLKLLDKGADVNVREETSGNALQAACIGGELRIIELLLQHGADASAQGGPHGNALGAAIYSSRPDIVQLLIDHGAEVDAQEPAYGTALIAASYFGLQETVQLLLDHGADVNATGGSLGTALVAASYHCRQDIVPLLLEHGIDVNAQGGHGASPLQIASLNGHEETVQLLLTKGANINAQGPAYGSALQAASYSGHQEIVQLLLEWGADVNAEGGRYGTALQAALEKGNMEIIQLLRSHGAVDEDERPSARYLATTSDKTTSDMTMSKHKIYIV